jgi:hypothetical protein
MSSADLPLTEHLRHMQKMSNAHLVHAAMPTIISVVDKLPLTDGIKASGLEIDGKPASVTLENRLVLALVKAVSANVDDACVRLISESPVILPVDERDVDQPPLKAT